MRNAELTQWALYINAFLTYLPCLPNLYKTPGTAVH
jgi:hypothetical protein